MKLPLFPISLVLICLVVLSRSSEEPAVEETTLKQLSNKIVRDAILSPDGKDINFEALIQIIKKLVQFHDSLEPRSVKNNKKKIGSIRTQSVESDPGLLLNRFLTVGNHEPPETQSQELSVACDLCASVVEIVGLVVQIPGVDVWSLFVEKVAHQVCPLVTKGFPKYMCDGYVDNFQHLIKYLLPNLAKSGYSVCNRFFENKLHCGTPDQQRVLWEVPIPEPLPEALPPQIVEETPAKDKLTVLFMADLHIDSHYAPGSPGHCIGPMCCNNDSLPANNPMQDGDIAGYWGDYRTCDLYPATLDNMFQHINKTHGGKIDFIMLGGDYISHDSWRVNREHHKELLQMIADKLEDNFPGIPYYLALGNHDASPINCYAFPGNPPEFSTQWLYDKLFDITEKWVNRSESEESMKKGGFFTTLLRPGWRLVVLNDNFNYDTNFLIFGQPDIPDPHGQLKWFAQVLADAEKKGERVHIVAHQQPASGGVFQAFSYNYYRIISRFSHIITSQFHGHAHDDFIVIYYDAETLTKPASVSYVGPPVTPYGGNNIGYRLYDFDARNYTLLNYHQYYADIESANKDSSKIDWRFEYSAREAYSLEDMSPATWNNFLNRMQTNFTLFDIYKKHFHLSMTNEGGCDEDCHRGMLCDGYCALSNAGYGFCEHFFPDKKEPEQDPSKEPLCSSRFAKRWANDHQVTK